MLLRQCSMHKTSSRSCHRTPYLHNQPHTQRSLACRAAPQQNSSVQDTPASSEQQEQDPAYKYSDGVNQFLGNFLPSSKAARGELSVDFDAPKLSGLSLQELAQLVEQGLNRTQWFVTGDVDARIFADNFAFKDESVATTGIKAYATGVRKLFDQVGASTQCLCLVALRGAARPAAKTIQNYFEAHRGPCCGAITAMQAPPEVCKLIDKVAAHFHTSRTPQPVAAVLDYPIMLWWHVCCNQPQCADPHCGPCCSLCHMLRVTPAGDL